MLFGPADTEYFEFYCRIVNGPISSGPNPKTNLKPKSCPKKPKSYVWSKKFSNLAKLFWVYFCAPKTKSTSQAQIKPEIFVNFRPEPGPNPTRKALPDLQLCFITQYHLRVLFSCSRLLPSQEILKQPTALKNAELDKQKQNPNSHALSKILFFRNTARKHDEIHRSAATGRWFRDDGPQIAFKLEWNKRRHQKWRDNQ